MITTRPAVGYIRKSPTPASSMSSLGKANKGRYTRATEKSIQEQQQSIEQLASRHGCKVIRWYIDESWQGDDEDRPAFGALMEIAQSPGCDFQVVLCWSQDRFSRADTLTAAVSFYVLRENDISLISVVEGVILDPDAEEDLAQDVIRNINQYGKNRFLKDHALNTSRAKHAQAKAGVWGCNPPYATRARDDGRLEAGDPGEIRVLRWIFQSFVDGMSQTAIARHLNRQGVPSPAAGRLWKVRGGTTRKPTSGKWSSKQIHNTLRQRVYAGDRRWGVRHVGKHIRLINGEAVTVPRKHKNVPQLDPAGGIAPDIPPFVGKPLIPQALWLKAQSILDRAAEERDDRRTSRSLPLVGLAKCGLCGCGLITHRVKGVYNNYEYYRCSSNTGHMRTAGISTHKDYSLPADELWKMVVDKLINDLLHPVAVEKIVKDVGHALQSQRHNAEVLPTLEMQAADAKAKLVTVRQNMLYAPTPEAVAEFSAEVGRLRTQLDSLNTSISSIKALSSESTKSVKVAQGQVREFLERMRADLLSGDPEKAVEVMHTMLKAVVVHIERIEPKKRTSPKSRATVNITGITLVEKDAGKPADGSLETENHWLEDFRISKLLAAARVRSRGKPA